MPRVPRSLLAVAALAAAGLTAVAAPATAAPSAPVVPSSPSAPARGAYDARQGATPAESGAIARRSAVVSAGAAVARLRGELGRQGLVDIDGLTGTPRQVTRLDGLLTGPSPATASAVALGYVRAHADVFGLGTGDLANLTLRRDYVDVEGMHHLSWTQSAGGVPLFGNGLQAAVTADGRLVTVFGSPVAGLTAPTGLAAPTVADGGRAVALALADLHDPHAAVAGTDSARRVLFATTGGIRSAWETVTMSAARPAVHVIDAASGRVLYRQSISSDAGPTAPTTPAATRPAATGVAFDYFPSAPRGGTTHAVDYTANGWLPATATVLSGNNSHAYSDVNDDDRAGSNEEVGPSSGTAWNYPLRPISAPYSFCGNPYPCTWKPDVPYSWRANRAQNTAQVFYFVNTWHDHLERAPIGFTEDAGNFQAVNRSGSGLGGDPVLTETEDGAGVAKGLPDASHVNNANMATPPDGRSPRMQMYLQHEPGTTYPDEDPWAPTDVGDEADTVYHEYTHGLSNRLVVDASGRSTLGAVQAGAMGEAWSDWYAMDYLVARGLQADTATPGDVVLFQFDGAAAYGIDRTEPLDCPVGTTSRRCPGTAGAGPGGYTYGDYGKVIGRPEVHSDGEIWAQTLWDLRGALGSTRTESLATRAMELSPADPSFLDERNAILTADNALYAGRDVAAIWRVFAHRGMGWFAGALDGGDSAPVEDFSLPPSSSTPTGTLTGRVVDLATRAGVANAVVSFGGHGAPAAGGYTATSDATGRYTVSGVFAGTYPKVRVLAPGYDPVATTVSVNSGTTTRNFALRRDLAAASGGVTIVSFTGPDLSDYGCGPVGLIDQSLSSGWGSESDLVDGAPGPDTAKQVVLKLPAAADIGTIAIDPSGTCGDDPTAGVADWSVEFSGNGTTWTPAASGRFGPADNGHLNRVAPAAGTGTGVRFVRFTAKTPQAVTTGVDCSSSAASGCLYLDVTELALYAPGA